MATLLNAADLLTVRREWIDDLVDDHPEIGPSATVKTAAAAGAVSLSLQALGAGTIRRGTPIGHSHSGIVNVYTVTDDAGVLIVTGDATVGISPALLTSASVGEAIIATPENLNVFNSQNRVIFFPDTEVQDLADRAMRKWATQIEGARNRDEMFRIGIRYLATERKLSSSAYLRALIADDPTRGGQSGIDALKNQLERDAAYMERSNRGPRTFAVTR